MERIPASLIRHHLAREKQGCLRLHMLFASAMKCENASSWGQLEGQGVTRCMSVPVGTSKGNYQLCRMRNSIGVLKHPQSRLTWTASMQVLIKNEKDPVWLAKK